MDKTAFCVTASTNEYIYGCIRFVQRMKWLNSKYETIVCITQNITPEYIKLLEENGIKYYQIPGINKELDYSQASYIMALGPLSIIDYNTLIIFDADLILRYNVDKYIEAIPEFNTPYCTFYKRPYLDSFIYIFEGCYFCHPNKQLYDNITEFYKDLDYVQCENILFEYSRKYNLNNLFTELNSYYIQPVSTENALHFWGKRKPWNSYFTPLYNLFVLYSYEDFNKTLDNNWELLEFYHDLLCLNNYFNTDNYLYNDIDKIGFLVNKGAPEGWLKTINNFENIIKNINDNK